MRCMVAKHDCKPGLWQKGKDCKSGLWQKGQDCKYGFWQKGFWFDVAPVVGALDHIYIPAINASVKVKGLGRCTVLEVDVCICNMRLHRPIMNTPYEEIHALKIWHIDRALHRCTLLAVP